MSARAAGKWYEKYELWLVAVCIAVFAGLILASINRSSIWHDEGYSAVLIENNYLGIVERTALDVHPPLYYLLLKTWAIVFGDQIMTLRLFSAACMLGAILVTWRIFRKLYGAKAGLVALAAMSMGSFLVRYGQEMRMYGLASLLASLATFWYIKTYLGKQSSTWQHAAYGLIVLAGMYTQYFFVLVPAVHAFHYFFVRLEGSWLSRVKSLGPMLVGGLVAVLGFLPWLPTVQKQFGEVHGSFWIPKVGVETLTSTPIAMTVFRKQFQMTGFYGLIAVLALLAVVLLVYKFYVSKQDKVSRLLVLSIVLPPVLLFVLSLPPMQPSYQDRYMSFMAPIFYGVLGVAALQIGRRWRYGTGLALAAVASLLIYGQVSNFWDGNNHGWEPQPYFTMNSVIDQIQDDSPVYATSLWTYFDARSTVQDRGMANKTQVLFNQYPTKWMGNWSAIYERPELMTTTIPEDVNALWLVDESGQNQYHGEELSDFVEKQSYSAGYAKITRYIRK